MPGTIDHLLGAPRVRDTWPGSTGGRLAAQAQGGANLTHETDPYFDTADFSDSAPGNLRVDYVLPSRGLVAAGGAVFRPAPDSPLARLKDASDHHLVRVDVLRPRRQAFSFWKVRVPQNTARTVITTRMIEPVISASIVRSPRKVARSASTTWVNGLIREMA